MISRSGVKGELITISSKTGLFLDGLLFEAKNSNTIVIHLHGSYGNFYQASFLRIFARQYLERNISLLSLNTSSHDGFGEGYFEDGSFAYVGGAVSEFGNCVGDIDAMVEFATGFNKRVVLQGHSLGCDRVLHYAIERSFAHDLVLLAPCDSYALQARWLATQTVEKQIERLKQDSSAQEIDWLESKEYGVRQGSGWDYNLPVSRRAFLSIVDGPPFRLTNIAKPSTFHLPGNAAIYIGGRDVLETSPSEVLFEYFSSRFGSVKKIYEEQGDHMLVGCEARVASSISDWIHSNS